MAATPQDLVAAAICYSCIDRSMLLPAELYLLNQILANSGGAVNTGSLLCGAVDPVAAPTTTCAIYYNTATSSWWYWNGTIWVNQVSAALLSGGNLALSGVLTTYRGIAASGLPAIRVGGQLNGQVGAVASVATYTPTIQASIDVTSSILVTTSGTENFTAQVAYTDANNTARVATIPFRLLTGANVLIVNFANGAVPYVGVLTRLRVKLGTPVTVSTQGTFTGGVVYNVGADIREGS